MQALYKTALKYVIFIALSMSMAALFTYSYFDMEMMFATVIGILELVFLRCTWNWHFV